MHGDAGQETKGRLDSTAERPEAEGKRGSRSSRQSLRD